MTRNNVQLPAVKLEINPVIRRYRGRARRRPTATKGGPGANQPLPRAGRAQTNRYRGRARRRPTATEGGPGAEQPATLYTTYNDRAQD